MLKPRKLNEEVCTILKERLYNEYDAHYTYRAASNWMRGKGFVKAAQFFEQEANTELEHAKILQGYIVDWNDLTELPVIKDTPKDFPNFISIIEAGYKKKWSFTIYTLNLLKIYLT